MTLRERGTTSTNNGSISRKSLLGATDDTAISSNRPRRRGAVLEKDTRRTRTWTLITVFDPLVTK